MNNQTETLRESIKSSADYEQNGSALYVGQMSNGIKSRPFY